MKLKLPRDFTPSRPVPEEAFETYGDRVAPEIVEFWRQAGLGTFANGFIKVINPIAVSGAFGRLFEGSPVSQDVPLFATAFGDLITYGDEFNSYHESYGAGTFYGINFKRRVISEVGVRLPYLLHDLTGGFFQREMLNPEGYVAAKHSNRRLHLHECYAPSATEGKYGIMELYEFIDEAPRGPFGEG